METGISPLMMYEILFRKKNNSNHEYNDLTLFKS